MVVAGVTNTAGSRAPGSTPGSDPAGSPGPDPAGSPGPDPAGSGIAGTPVGRRVVLGMAGAGLAGILWGSKAQRLMGSALSPLTALDGLGLSGILPGANRFRIYSVVGFLPSVRPVDYRLQVDGLVNQPVTLSLADLQAMPATTLHRDFQCVTGWRVPRVAWKGVLLRQVLDRAGIAPGATAVSFGSFDGTYTESLTLDQAQRDDVMVAYEMLGAPVTTEHGGPVRLYVAPMYGYKSCKWLSHVRLVDRVQPGYWEEQGYAVDGWVGRSNGRGDIAT